MTNETKQSDFLRSIVDPEGLKQEVERHKQFLQSIPERKVYAKPCPRCAELEEQLHFQACLTRELLPYQDEAVQSRAKLAALEAENKSLKELFTVDKYGTTMADMYLDLKAENARLNATVAEMQPMLGEQQATIAQQAERIKELEARLSQQKGAL